jgi:NodT family efflux transporter outer membrane factor (OMF) lipoprotein
VKRALLLSLALLAGCATPVPESRPVQPLPPAWYAPAPDAPAPADWWRERLEDPALARLVSAALGNSPDLAGALARIDRARAGLRASEAERMPSIGGSAGVSASRNPPNELGLGGDGAPPGLAIDRERILYRAGIEGSWDADLFGRLAAERRAAAARLDAAGFDAAAVRLSLVTDVARNFVAARAAAAREAIARETVTSARESLAVAGERARAGLVPGIDRIRAENLVAEATAAIPPFQAERSARIAALAALTGLAPAEIDPLVGGASGVPRFDSPAAGVPSELLLRRPDVAAALARVAAADADTGAAIRARYPRLSITGSIGLVATTLGGLFAGDALGALAGPGISGSILDFGRNKSRVEESRARAAEAVAAYRDTILTAFAEVETNLAAIDARAHQRLALERQLASAGEAMEVARAQYRGGLTDFLGVLEAERALHRVRAAIAAADAEAADAQLTLFRAVGGAQESVRQGGAER